MLFKRDTATARDARLAAAEIVQPNDPASGQAPAGAREEPQAPAQPSLEQQEIARLSDENETLRRDLAALRQDWDEALSAAEMRAREVAARAHVADDGAQLRALSGALDAAAATFETALNGGIAQGARMLASDALARLVKPVASDSEWLARAIERRLGELRSQTVVAVHVPISLDEALLARVAASHLGGVTIIPDPGLQAGTARIALRLGQIELDLRRGIGEILQHIEQGDGDA